MAAEWYTARGYVVVARNWRCSEGELDLVARDGATLVFCEVKARGSATFGLPLEAVTRAKQARIRRLAGRWLAASRSDQAARLPTHTIRFDVASVLRGRLEMIESAF